MWIHLLSTFLEDLRSKLIVYCSYIGRSAEIVEKYCGPGGAVEKALAPYAEYIKGSGVAELSV